MADSSSDSVSIDMETPPPSGKVPTFCFEFFFLNSCLAAEKMQEKERIYNVEEFFFS